MKSKNYKYYQPNKKDLKDDYGDCVIRSFTKAFDMEWLEVFDELQPISREMQVPFNCKPCYEKYIESKDFKYYGISNKKGSKRPTVKQFAKEHKKGIYILRVAHHLVTVVDGIYYDTWDCGEKSLYGYWKKEICMDIKEKKECLEEKKIDRLYKLLEEGNLDNETSASLKWAIFELESIYCKEE